MPLIKPRTQGKQIVRHITRLYRENNETLYAYAEFLGEPTEYVLNQLIGAKLAKDKEFLGWRASHPETFVPRPTPRGRRRPAGRLGHHTECEKPAGSRTCLGTCAWVDGRTCDSRRFHG